VELLLFPATDAVIGAVVPVLVSTAAAALILAALAALIRRTADMTPALTVAGCVAAALAGVAALAGFAPGAARLDIGPAGLASIDIAFDGLGAVFLVALGISGAAAALSIAGTQARSRAEGAAFPLFLLSLGLVFGAADGFAFLFAWELMALLSALLVVGLRPNRTVASAGYLYVAMTHVATAAILVGFALLSTGAGGDLQFGTWRLMAASLSPAVRDVVFVLLLVGFATKAGALPLHAWLPRAHPVAPSHVSAVMSGVMIKAGVYGIIRFTLDVLGPGPDWWGVAILTMGAASAVMGILYALMQQDLKRLLAFSSIENVGIILLGVGAAVVLAGHGLAALAALALGAALVHSVNHAVMKTLLFLAAGSVLHATRLRDLNRLGGLGRLMPVTALTFAVGAAAISGLPPLNGFAGEWLTFHGLIAGAGATAVPPLLRFALAAAVGALALTAALALATFVKATGIAFLGLPRSAEAAGAHESAVPARASMGLLAAACVALGLAAGPASDAFGAVARTITRAADAGPVAATISSLPQDGIAPAWTALVGGLLLIAAIAGITALAGRAWRRTPPAVTRQTDTWTCGIAPAPAFQYNATSFAKPVRLFFRRILQPDRQIDVAYHPGTRFPVSISYRSDITLLLEDRVFAPLHAWSIRLAQVARKLQAGPMQLYVAYTVIAVLILLLWAR
jgi:formate hydrogenlyase subunit 3/multisubunit Na+/H+ antiporter MnhD subunit